MHLFKALENYLPFAYIVAAGAANDEADIKNNKKYFLPRGEIKHATY